MREKKNIPDSGRIRDKARSQEKLIQSIGDILIRKSYAELNISTVTKISQLNPKLIYLYFENLEGLIRTYLNRKISQKENALRLAEHMASIPHQVVDEDIFSLLEIQFEKITQDPEWKGILHWGMSCKNDLTLPLLKQHEKTLNVVVEILKKNKKLAEHIDPVLYALLAAGTTFIAINSRLKDAKLLGLDLNDEQTKKRIKDTLERILIKSG
ncbi:TetR/AcrR family transcriptional regulator [Sphingobacterium bambusae]|uniref:TetR/AcrR family transcriptional regulator n=1 Tax=Sphingobacterium bambusae TaxID=662858 RepID=A0ABW6BDL0_9SPHI|nr:TetR/AcrR family transcriptional regulator [Sphingobacterium bambusae]WPL46930.1 TetR/AcrR family transcriptional regulator [Sphingobacterium bambusae]